MCASVVLFKIMENFKIFAKNLKTLRESHCLSMSELAELLFLKTSAGVNEFESGRSKPSLETAINIATLFGTSLEWLTGLSGEPYTIASITAANVAKAERIKRVDPDDNIGSIITLLSRDLGLQPQIRASEPSLALQGNYIFLINASILNDLEHLQKEAGTPLEQLTNRLGNKKPSRLDKRKIERYILFLKAHYGYFEVPLFPFPTKP
jgi:transcriptional regulator with XRE-family HTH domain